MKKAICVVLVIIGIVLIVNTPMIANWLDTLNEGTVEELVDAIKTYGVLAPIVSVGLMVLQAFIAPIPSFLITGANGVIFGTFWGVIISWVGAMIGAAGTFYLARLLGIDFVRRFEKDGSLLSKVDEMSEVHGTKVIFIGRLLPFVSFDFLSYAAGLSRIPPYKFFIATGIGMLPGTVAYVVLGAQIIKYSGSLNQMLLGIAILIVATWTIYRIIKWQKERNL